MHVRCKVLTYKNVRKIVMEYVCLLRIRLTVNSLLLCHSIRIVSQVLAVMDYYLISPYLVHHIQINCISSFIAQCAATNFQFYSCEITRKVAMAWLDPLPSRMMRSSRWFRNRNLCGVVTLPPGARHSTLTVSLLHVHSYIIAIHTCHAG
jgi:hypothetical protein